MKLIRRALFLSLFIFHSSLFLPAAPETGLSPASLSSYEVGDPLAPQLAFESHLRNATPAQRTAVETELIALIAAPATTTAAKNVFLNWLGWIGTEKSIPTLTEAAKTPDLAHAAISTLATLNVTEEKYIKIINNNMREYDYATGALVALIENDDATSDAALIEVLGALGQRRSTYMDTDLSETRINATPAIYTAAYEAFGNAGTTLDDIIDFSDSGEISQLARERPLSEIRALLAGIENTLRRASTEKPDSHRVAATKIYAEILGATTDPVTRVETAQLLASLDPTNPALLQFAADSDARLRNVIACGMATSGNPDAIKILVNRFADIAPDTQSRMMAALVTAPSPAALPLVERALASENPGVQLAAIAAAGSGGNETTVPTLVALLASENKAVAAAAFTALTQLPDCDGKTNAALHRADAAAPIAPQLLRIRATRQDRDSFAAAMTSTASPDTTLRTAAYEAVALLTRSGDLSAILSIDAAPNRREWTKALYTAAALHPDSAAAVALLQKHLAAASPADRPALIAALTMINAPESKAALDAMLTHANINVRKETIRALSSARSETAFDLLVERIAAATDASERLLAQRGAIDTIDHLELPAAHKIAAYRKLWKIADTRETKDAIIAAVKRMRGSAAAAFLKEISAQK